MNSHFLSGGMVSYGTLLHEIGHAIGLKHPTETVTDFAHNPALIVHDQVLVSGDDPTKTIMATVADFVGRCSASASARQGRGGVHLWASRDGRRGDHLRFRQQRSIELELER